MKQEHESLYDFFRRKFKPVRNLDRRFCNKCGKRKVEYGRSICIQCLMKEMVKDGLIKR